MLVSTKSMLTLPGNRSASTVASLRAKTWSSTSRSRSARATRAAAAMTPACLIPPPNRFRRYLISSTADCSPQTIDPTGAPSPFEKQNWIVSADAAHRSAGKPVAATALKMRAPSMWIASPCSRAVDEVASIVSIGMTLPPERLCVFSQTSSPILG